GKGNRKPHVLVFDGLASHLTFEVMKLNIELLQLPSPPAHIMQPFDVTVW
ncbi:unnamed protein product, partial [Sphacelaria rigidula]